MLPLHHDPAVGRACSFQSMIAGHTVLLLIRFSRLQHSGGVRGLSDPTDPTDRTSYADHGQQWSPRGSNSARLGYQPSLGNQPSTTVRKVNQPNNKKTRCRWDTGFCVLGNRSRASQAQRMRGLRFRLVESEATYASGFANETHRQESHGSSFHRDTAKVLHSIRITIDAPGHHKVQAKLEKPLRQFGLSGALSRGSQGLMPKPSPFSERGRSPAQALLADESDAPTRQARGGLFGIARVAFSLLISLIFVYFVVDCL